MNKIEMKNNSIYAFELDDKIEIKEVKGLVSTFRIIFKKSTDLEIEFDSIEETKLRFEYELFDDVNVNLYEIRAGFKTKIEYKYNIKKNASLYLYRLNKSEFMREVDLINLNGENAKIEFNLKSLSKNSEKYDIYVWHNNRSTTSIINDVGIALNGSIIFNVTGEVPKGNKGSYLDQNNQIVAFNTTKCQINPNLLIDEFDVVANHNAIIGPFREDALFYLMSRGINEEAAIKLLCEGLILNNLKENYKKENVLNFIKDYWG